MMATADIQMDGARVVVDGEAEVVAAVPGTQAVATAQTVTVRVVFLAIISTILFNKPDFRMYPALWIGIYWERSIVRRWLLALLGFTVIG